MPPPPLSRPRRPRKRHPSPPQRRVPARVKVGVAGLTVVLAILLLITLSPQQVDAGRDGMIDWVLSALHTVGVPASFGYRELEFSANIVMFVPLGFFTSLILSRRPWSVMLMLPLVVSVFVELAQLLLLPMRVASLADVVANTAGGWIGALVAVIVGAVTARRSYLAVSSDPAARVSA